MFRAKWTTILVAALSCAGPVLAQKPPSSCPRVVTIQEAGKPALQCRVLKTWAEGTGVAFEVEVLATGEHITLVESGPIARHAGSGKVVQEMRSRIYHWAQNAPPPGAPMAPPDALVPGTATVQMARPTVVPAAIPMTQGVGTPMPKVTATAAVVGTPMPNVAVSPVFAPAVGTPMPNVAATPSASPSQFATVTPVPTPSLAVVTPAPKTANNVSPAQPSDWHQSWGKADDHKSKADDPKKAKDDKVAASPEAQPPSQMPAKVELPQAARNENDPLADPGPYSPYHVKHQDDTMPTVQVTPGEGVAKKKDEKADDDDPLKLDDEPRKDAVASADKKDTEHGDKKDAEHGDKKDAEHGDKKDAEHKDGDKKDAEHKDDVKKTDVASKADTAKPGDKKELVGPPKPLEKKPEPSVRLTERFKNFFSRKDADKAKGTAADKTEEPAGPDSGMRSVYAACEAAGMPASPPPGMVPLPSPLSRTLPTPPPLVDTDPSNAFTTVVRRPAAKPKPVPSEQANAFDGSRPKPEMQPYQVPGGMPGTPPMPPRGYAGMPPMPPGVAPMPAYVQAPPRGYAGMPPIPPPGVVPMPAYAQAAPPAVMPAGYVPPPATPPAPAAASDGSQLFLILRSSLFPSNREWAADQLGSAEWGSNPVAVEMLLQSAKNDPAPTVRAACVRNIAKMNARSPNVIEVLTALQKDEDSAVRNEVTRTLAKLQAASPTGARPVIQPASMR